MKTKGFIDLIINRIAIISVDKKSFIEIPKSILPENVKEGDYVEINININCINNTQNDSNIAAI